MMKKIAIIAVIALIVLASGCILGNQAANKACGNKVCDAGENETNCPADCTGQPPMPSSPDKNTGAPELPF